jgi:hypothetical protein
MKFVGSTKILEAEGGSSGSHTLELSLEEAMDLSQDRLLLELETTVVCLLNTTVQPAETAAVRERLLKHARC